MNGTETLSQTVDRLARAGYTDGFRAVGGMLKGMGELSYEPSEFLVDEIVRFEGTTNLDDEAMIFALTHTRSRVKGIYVVAFGQKMDIDDVDIVQRLPRN